MNSNTRKNLFILILISFLIFLLLNFSREHFTNNNVIQEPIKCYNKPKPIIPDNFVIPDYFYKKKIIDKRKAKNKSTKFPITKIPIENICNLKCFYNNKIVNNFNTTNNNSKNPQNNPNKLNSIQNNFNHKCPPGYMSVPVS